MTRGICRICGNYRELTKDHVLPRAAGNSARVCVRSLYALSKGWSRGEIFQAGLTRSTLCARCNSLAGIRYVPAFARWTLQAYEYHGRVPEDSRIALPFTLSALRIAKQLAVMTLAMSEPPSLDLPWYYHLRQLVMQPRRYGRVPRFRFFTYFDVGAPVLEATFAAIDTSGGPSPMIFCQVGIEPLGYVVTGDDDSSIAWARRLNLCSVSHFFQFPLDALRTEHLVIPRLRGEMPFRRRRNALCDHG